MIMELMNEQTTAWMVEGPFGCDGILYICYLRTRRSPAQQYVLAKKGNRDALVNLVANKTPSATRYKLRYCMVVDDIAIMRKDILDSNDPSAILAYYDMVERRDDFYHRLLDMDPDIAAEYWYEYLRKYGADSLVLNRLAHACGRQAGMYQYMYLHDINSRNQVMIDGLARNYDAAEYQYMYCAHIRNDDVVVKGLLDSKSENRARWWYHYLQHVEWRADIYLALMNERSAISNIYKSLLKSLRRT